MKPVTPPSSLANLIVAGAHLAGAGNGSTPVPESDRERIRHESTRELVVESGSRWKVEGLQVSLLSRSN